MTDIIENSSPAIQPVTAPEASARVTNNSRPGIRQDLGKQARPGTGPSFEEVLGSQTVDSGELKEVLGATTQKEEVPEPKEHIDPF